MKMHSIFRLIILSGLIISTYSSIYATDRISGNSADTIAEVIGMKTSFDSIIVVRFRNGTDILEGLKQTGKMFNLKNAVILTGIGSVTSYHLHSVDNSTFPSENVFLKEENPSDITNISGYFINGRLHAHITLSDELRAIGGHLEPGTKVFKFCVITIGILPDEIDISRYDDKTWR